MRLRWMGTRFLHPTHGDTTLVDGEPGVW